MPDIFWLIKAQRSLEEALCLMNQRKQYAARYAELCRVLADTFPNAAAVIVRDRLQGFRPRANIHVLLVEVCHKSINLPSGGSAGPSENHPSSDSPTPASGVSEGAPPQPSPGRMGQADFDRLTLGESTRTTVHIVKISEPEILAKELTAWESCRPAGFTHDSVLTVLLPGARSSGPEQQLLSIVYEDTHHLIGSGSIVSLEQVVIDCCRWGVPSVASLKLVFKSLYDRLGMDFCSRSREDLVDDAYIEQLQKQAAQLTEDHKNHDCDESDIGNVQRTLADSQGALANYSTASESFDRIGGRLTGHLSKWQDELKPKRPQPDYLRARREVFSFLSSRRDGFIEPIDYLKSVCERPQHCPQLLCGYSHGDFHGRNALVAIVDGDAMFPAVFDYEDMASDNLIGWDFVKMETELKVRALDHILPKRTPTYLMDVYRFERYLAKCTHAIHDQYSDDEKFRGADEAQRLAELVLAIRRLARQYLGRGRGRRWLEEYYFLLAWYGVHAATWDTYQVRERIAAYVAAGVAARLLTRPWHDLDEEIRLAADFGKCAFNVPTASAVDARYTGHQDGEMGHHVRLAFATQLWRNAAGDKRQDALAKAVELLKQLREEYPHVADIDAELALVYLRQSEQDPNRWVDAENVLRSLRTRYRLLSEEPLTRIGKYFKQQAIQNLPDQTQAKPLYQRALDYYSRAYSLFSHFFPGINVATLQFLLEQHDLAGATAEAVIEYLKSPKVPLVADDQPWVAPTRGEALLLLANYGETEKRCEDSKNSYLLAKDSPRDNRSTSRQQAQLIVVHSIPAVKALWPNQEFDRIFGEDSRPDADRGIT